MPLYGIPYLSNTFKRPWEYRSPVADGKVIEFLIFFFFLDVIWAYESCDKDISTLRKFQASRGDMCDRSITGCEFD